MKHLPILIVNSLLIAGCHQTTTSYDKCTTKNIRPELLIPMAVTNADNAVAAYEELQKCGEEALPTLILHVSDYRELAPVLDKYQGEEIGAFTVSSMCRDIVFSMLGFRSAKHAAFSPAYISDLQLWYKQREGIPLSDLKAEVLKYRIKMLQETKTDFLWRLDDNQSRDRISELKKQLKHLAKDIDLEQYEWQRPATLTREECMRIAREYISENTEIKWDDYTECHAYLDGLLDCWVVRIRQALSEYEYHWAHFLISDNTSDIIQFKDGSFEFPRPLKGKE